MHRQNRLVGTMGAWVLMSTMAIGACDDGVKEDVVQSSSEIVNGISVSNADANLWGLVALYHRTATSTGAPGPWWPRPCTATIVAHRVGEAYVLTARHCVTHDGTVDGTIIPPDWIRLATGANPGLPNPNPPVGAKPARWIYGMGISPSIPTYDRDTAIVAVTAPEWASLASRKGMQMTPAIAGVTLHGYGYGLNVRNEACYGNGSITTGAGTLRRGVFTSLGGTPLGDAGRYTYPYNASSGPSIICGDSGGPDIGNIAPDMVWSSVHGVHAGDDIFRDQTISTASGPWVSWALEGFWLSPMTAPSQNLTWRADDVVYLANTPNGVPFIYNPVAKTIYYEFDDVLACLEWDGGERDSFFMAPCNSAQPYQTWEVTSRGYIRNPATNLCMRHMVSGWVEVRSCPATTAAQSERARFTWVWHPQY